MSVRFYGFTVDEDHFTGRLGRVVKGLNRVREVVERMTEIAAVLHDADENGEPLAPVVARLHEEGVRRPAPEKTRAPLHVLQQFRTSEPDDPSIEGRFYSTRDYSARVGRRLDVERREREQGVTLDDNMSLRTTRRLLQARASRYAASPLVRECFRPVGEDQ